MPQVRYKSGFRALIFILLLCSRLTTQGQLPVSIQDAENRLKLILVELNLAQNDSMRSVINEQFSDQLFEVLSMPESDTYHFDSLKTLAKITSPDQKFRIFHWNLPTSDRKHHYYGFIKIKNQSKPLIFKLIDKSDSLESPEYMSCDTGHWFGALYYKIIQDTSESGEPLYTLLGWSGQNASITRKVIEVITIDPANVPRFGKEIFPNYEKGGMQRIIFRYSASTSMSLKYEKQVLEKDKKWNPRKRTFEYSMEEYPIIVFDRMIAPDPQLDGQFQFYIAAGDVNDAFVFRNHSWLFKAGIEARNKK